MSEAVAQVTHELYRFLVEHDAAVRGRRLLSDAQRALGESARQLSAHLGAARAGAAELLTQRLDDAASALVALIAELQRRSPESQHLQRVWATLGRSYEGLRLGVRKLHVPAGAYLRQLKPPNIARNVFHVVMSLVGVLLYELVLDRTGVLIVGGSLLGVFVALEIARRLSPSFNRQLVEGVFGRISRPGEAHQVPAATWYLAALVLGVVTMPQHAIELGALVLGFGDPAASLVGTRFGRIKLVGDKSLVGTAAFFLAGGLIATLFLGVVVGLAPAVAIGIGAAASGVAAIVEAVSGRIDDNFTVPLAAGLVAMLLL